MKFIFTKITLLGLVVYTLLCLNGKALPPSDVWGFAAIIAPVAVLIQVEGMAG